MTVDKTSPIITLLSPAETEHGYFAEFGYVGSEATGTTSASYQTPLINCL